VILRIVKVIKYGILSKGIVSIGSDREGIRESKSWMDRVDVGKGIE